MQTLLRTESAPIDLRGYVGSRWARATRRYLILILTLAGAACGDSILAPFEKQVVFEPAAEIEAFEPAIHDLRDRILPSSRDAFWMAQAMAHLARLEAALAGRDGFEAEQAYSDLVDDLASCRVDRCLSAPDRSVLEFTLEYARNLFGWSAT